MWAALTTKLPATVDDELSGQIWRPDGGLKIRAVLMKDLQVPCEALLEEFKKLPGIGSKSAQRLASL